VAVLVVQAGTALASQLVDAAEQVRRVGTRLLGAVLLPRHITVPQDGTAFGSRPRGQREPSDFDMWNSTVDDAGTVDPPTSAFKQLDPAGLEPRRHAAD
jgi:hypothetical protein